MRRSWLGIVALLAGIALALPDAEAKRLDRGHAVKAHHSAKAPASTAAPTKPAAATPASPASTSDDDAPDVRWAPVAGAATLGLLGFIGFALLRLLRSPRAAPSALQYAGLGNETVAAPPPSQAIGFDVRAAIAGARAHLPTGFDVSAFLRAAKENFIRLQMASDRGRFDELRDMTTTGMFEALRADARSGARTDVVTLQADVLEVATEGDRHWASVRFSGLVRQTPGAEPAGFGEVWNLVKPVDGATGWLLAGIQPLH
ncbi:MAG: Tim44 domain-containing protein [Burkholderiales bacterium]